MSSVNRGMLQLSAGVDGSIVGARLPLRPPPELGCDLPRSHGVAIVALRTRPGRRAPLKHFDVLLLDSDGDDVLGGQGRRRRPDRQQTMVIRDTETGEHPVITDDTLRLEIPGRHRPGCQVIVDVFVADVLR